MTRLYLNGKYCVRCGRKRETPYLRKNWKLLIRERRQPFVIDIGCGNGRNSKFMENHGCQIFPLDMVDDFGMKITLGHDPIPLPNNSVDIILANYIFMFLDNDERDQLIGELKRVAKPMCKIMVELYAAKDSYTPTKEEVDKLQRQLCEKLGWIPIKYNTERFIAEKLS